jgi:DNA excision repair protein ERCC-2
VRAARACADDGRARLPGSRHRRGNRARGTAHPDALREHFESLCERYAAWAQQEADHHGALDRTLAQLAFPHQAFRTGQRELAEAVYRAAAGGRCLMAQAPTGIGKTLATIFPLFKARAAGKLDKVFFLTAKTSGRPVALDALRVLGKGCAADGAQPRVLELAAREKVCEYPDRACNGDSCPLAKGFYDRLPAARAKPQRPAGSTGRRCGRSRCSTRCAPISSRRKWPTGAT